MHRYTRNNNFLKIKFNLIKNIEKFQRDRCLCMSSSFVGLWCFDQVGFLNRSFQMTNPSIQNDFSFYRRMRNRVKAYSEVSIKTIFSARSALAFGYEFFELLVMRMSLQNARFKFENVFRLSLKQIIDM